MAAFSRVKLVVAAGFALAVLAAFLFGYRAGRHAWRLRLANEPIRPWMSVPFVAHTHHVPPDRLYQAIGLPPVHPRDRRPLWRIARDQHRRVEDVIRDLNRAIAANRPPEPPLPKRGP